MSTSATSLVELVLLVVVEVVEVVGEDTVIFFVVYEVVVLGDLVFSSTAVGFILAARDEPQKSAPVPH